MGNWLIEPIDPLIVRDGRPFGPTPGARARTLPFPFPQTIAGAVRTREGLRADGRFDTSRSQDVLRFSSRGPLLVELGDDGQPTRFLFPAPSDALLLEEVSGGPGIVRRVLEPMQPPAGVVSDLPDHLALVGMRGEVSQEKPAKEAPAFWHWTQMEAWLLDPQRDDTPISRRDLGIRGLPVDTRMHVSIDHQTQTADEGALFMTAGLSFSSIPYPSGDDGAPLLSAARRYALYVESDAPAIKAGLAPLGGERRTMQWRKAEGKPLPGCPKAIEEAIASAGACRIVLATPAYLDDVTRPGYLAQPHAGVTATVSAIAVARSETVSGWDFAAERTDDDGKKVFGAPKPTRRLAPAGTVLWLTLDGDEAQRRTWVQAMWLQSISDDEASRRDGYGLALLGTWDGTITPWGSER